MATKKFFHLYPKSIYLLMLEIYQSPSPRPIAPRKPRCLLHNKQRNLLFDTFAPYIKYILKISKVRFLGQAVLAALTFASLRLILFPLQPSTPNMDPLSSQDERRYRQWRCVFLSIQESADCLESARVDQPTPQQCVAGFSLLLQHVRLLRSSCVQRVPL